MPASRLSHFPWGLCSSWVKLGAGDPSECSARLVLSRAQECPCFPSVRSIIGQFQSQERSSGQTSKSTVLKAQTILPDDVRKRLGFGANGQERIPKMSLMQKGDFIKARDRHLGRKSCTRVTRSGPFYTLELRGGWGQRKPPKYFGSKVSRTLRGLAVARRRSFITV